MIVDRPPRRSAAAEGAGRPWRWLAAAAAAFAALCIVALSTAPQLVEPDDHAYQASIIAATQGHWLTLSTAQVHALGADLRSGQSRRAVRQRAQRRPAALIQWVQLPDGRWIGEKDPGYPFLAAPFQWLGLIRLAPLFYGALGCLGLYAGARRWLGDIGGAAAVGLFCSSGAALIFAWRDYMPTFTDASLIAAGTGALLWALLADEAIARWRTGTGLLGFLALEAAVFVRYTDLVVLGCAVAAVLAVRWRRAASVPARGSGLVARLGRGVRRGRGHPRRPGLRRSAPIRLPAWRSNLRPRRGPGQPAVHARAPDPGHAHAGPRAGRAGLDHRAPRAAQPGRRTSRAASRAATSPSPSPWPRRGSAGGGFTPPTPGPPSRA